MESIYDLEHSEIIEMLRVSPIEKMCVELRDNEKGFLGFILLDDRFYRIFTKQDEILLIEEVSPEPIVSYDYKQVKVVYSKS